MWWWGEQELPGLQAFVDDSVKNYTAATVKTMLQDTAVVISQFQTAAAAGKAPDIQYLWNGIYHMESVWLGYLQPLDGPGEATRCSRPRSPTLLSHFGGKTYRIGWYPLPMIWIYNKDLFDKAGLDADKPPQDLGRSARRLRQAEDQRASRRSAAASRTAIGANGTSAMRSRRTSTAPARSIDLFTGERDFRDPKYHEHWVRLEELKKHDFLNADMSSLELYPGIDLIVAGKLGDGPVDRRARSGRQQDDQRPDRHHGHAGLRQGQDGRQADPRFPGPRHLDQCQGSRRRPRPSSNICNRRSG